MYESPDYKDLEKIVINSDVVQEKSEPLLIFSNKQINIRRTAKRARLQIKK